MTSEQTKTSTAQEASSLLEFLTFVRRRLKISSTLSQLELMLPLAAVAVFSVILVDKFVFWAWLDFIPWVICASVMTFLVLRHITLSVSLKQAAQAADRQLASQDALSTAHQFADLTGVFGNDISSRAQRVISRTSPAKVVPLSFNRTPLLATAALGLASICIALLLDPAVRPISIQELERAAINAEKEKILEEASQLRNDQASPDQEELAEKLEELAKQLEQSDSLEIALTQTERARSEIEASITDSFLAEKSAVQGLNRSLQAMPLTDDADSPGDAATQFENLSKNLDALSEQERDQLAERLDALADTQQSGNLDLAESLQQASEALQSGDLGQASDALNSSAQAQQAGEDSLADQTARSDAADTLGDTINRFNNLQQPGQGGGQPSGQQPGQGDGQQPGQQPGQDDGQPGQPSGQQPGQGVQPGQGGGQPGQGGGQSGQQPGQDGQPGQGDGQPIGTGAGRDAEDDTTPSVWLPAESVDILQADGNSSSEPGGTGEIVGLGQVQSSSSGTRIPVDEVVSTYRDEAVKSLNRGQVPPTAQDLVRDYFDTIAGLSKR